MYSQRDPLWSDVRLGTSSRTLGSTGCLVTVVAEFLRGVEGAPDPASLNRWLVNHGGFVEGNRLVFGAIEPLGLHLESIQDWTNTPADVETVQYWLRNELRVAVEVNYHPWSAFTMHWLGVLSATPLDLIVHDPWLPVGSQQPVRLLPRYAQPSWDLERAIYRAVAYRLE